MNRRHDILVSDLCYEIDELSREVDHWKKKYDELHEEYINHMNENIANSQKGIGQMLMLALSSKEDENGNLVIDREGRKAIVDSVREDETDTPT